MGERFKTSVSCVASALLSLVVALSACKRDPGTAARAAEPGKAAPPTPAAVSAANPASATTTSPSPEPVKPFPSGLSGQLVFQSDAAGRPKIYTLDLATGRIAALTMDQQYRDENPRWSPDGRRIVFKSNRAHYGAGAEPGTPDFDLYVMNADGSGVRRLTTDSANEQDPYWAPDGQSIVYSSDRESRGDLFRLFLADGRTERLTRHFVGRAIMPAVAPDGNRVAFAAQTLNRGTFWLFQVHLLDLAGKTTSALDGTGGACWPGWAPDGRRLAYVLLDEEPSALEMLDLQTGQRQRLVNDRKLWSYYPSWAPDGQRLAFSVSPEHHDGEDWDLAMLTVGQPGQFTRLTTGTGNDRLPDWRRQ